MFLEVVKVNLDPNPLNFTPRERELLPYLYLVIYVFFKRGVNFIIIMFLEVKQVAKKINDAFHLQPIYFKQAAFQKMAICGETGSGKSTLLKIIAGLEQPDTGQVNLGGKRILGPLEQLVPGHPAIAYLSQHYELKNNYRVEELLTYANRIGESAAQDLFTVCRINHLLKRRTDALSGGEKQRIAIARLLIGAPELLILDEPFSNLDLPHKQILKEVINDISQQLSITILLSSHDPLDILSWAEHLLVLRDGKVIQEGAPEIIYHQPNSEYVAGLFGKYYLIDLSLYPQLLFGNNIFPTPKYLMVRPEYLRVVPGSAAHLQAIVTNRLFQGSFFEMEMVVQGQILSTYLLEEPPPVGAQVSLQLSIAKPCFIS